METAPQHVEKPKRVMSQEQLDKLAHAREMALKKRREMAAVRAEDREALVLEKINAKNKRDDARAEKEATQRLERRLDVDHESHARSTPTVEVSKPKRQAIVVETSDTDDEEGLIENARVFVVKRQISTPVAPAPAPPTAPIHVAPIDPHAALYKSMFG